jgi:3-isopropylmalate/(R)-2-methylmalate dehydratase large subunit
MATKTLFHKVWERHLMESECDGQLGLLRTELMEQEACDQLPSPGKLSVGSQSVGWHGAFGALALKLDQPSVEKAKRDGMVVMRKPNVMAVHIMGSLKQAQDKEAIEAINRVAFADLDHAQAAQTVVEYVGPGVAEMDMETRMQLCQHAVDQGLAAAIMAPDEKTFEFIKPEAHDHRDRTWDLCLKSWRSLFADMFAIYDQEAYLNACRI